LDLQEQADLAKKREDAIIAEQVHLQERENLVRQQKQEAIEFARRKLQNFQKT